MTPSIADTAERFQRSPVSMADTVSPFAASVAANPLALAGMGSAVSWGAIVAGAAAAAALSLILLILGVGLGLSSVSPWAHDGVSAGTLGVSSILWLTVTQLLASALGGFLAGRLRTRWQGTHADEVYFRDTAHGFLAWAVSGLATAALLASVITSILSGGAQAGAAVAARLPEAAAAPMAYFVDSLFRRPAAVVAATPVVEGGDRETARQTTRETAPDTPRDTAREIGRDTAEVARIFGNLSRTEALPTEDLRYVGQLVAQKTGLTQVEAERRVSATYERAQGKLSDAEAAVKAAADKARKAAAYTALWLFVSLLVGAFVASLSATFGGRLRDA